MHSFINPLKLATGSAGLSLSEDVTLPANLSFQSTSSYCTSDSSAPPTPTFSLRGHSRFPSSSSSLASSSHSPICEHSDVCGSASKLPMPKLAEEPTEHDDSTIGQYGTIQDISTACKINLILCHIMPTNICQSPSTMTLQTAWACVTLVSWMRAIFTT
jgi:hypothetical protein